MGLLAARQAEMAEAVVSWSRLRFRIAMIDSLALARGSHSQRTTRSGRLGLMGLHRGYICTALAGLLLPRAGGPNGLEGLGRAVLQAGLPGVAIRTRRAPWRAPESRGDHRRMKENA
jgi:hypothetical protein